MRKSFKKKSVMVCARMYVHVACSVVPNSLRPHGLQPTSLLCPWEFPARTLEWVAISSSKGSSRPRDWTRVSCISCLGRWILPHCTTWEAQGPGKSSFLQTSTEPESGEWTIEENQLGDQCSSSKQYNKDLNYCITIKWFTSQQSDLPQSTINQLSLD